MCKELRCQRQTVRKNVLCTSPLVAIGAATVFLALADFMQGACRRQTVRSNDLCTFLLGAISDATLILALADSMWITSKELRCQERKVKNKLLLSSVLAAIIVSDSLQSQTSETKG